MALPDKEINTVLDQYNQRIMEDPEFAKLAEENPISAFDQLARARESELAAEQRGSFPVEVPGQLLTLEELRKVRTRN